MKPSQYRHGSTSLPRIFLFPRQTVRGDLLAPCKPAVTMGFNVNVLPAT